MTLADDRRTAKARAEGPIFASYQDDPYTWALQQADLLRAGHLEHIDTVNLADEITALAHYLADKLRSDLSRVLQHLLKWDHQPDRRSRSWAISIAEHRRRTFEHLQDGPGLKSLLPQILERAYADGRSYALKQTNVPNRAIPDTCPYTWDEIMTRPVEWPEP